MSQEYKDNISRLADALEESEKRDIIKHAKEDMEANNIRYSYLGAQMYFLSVKAKTEDKFKDNEKAKAKHKKYYDVFEAVVLKDVLTNWNLYATDAE